MSSETALQRLKSGHAVECVAPNGTAFRIESKLSHGLAWYRAQPARQGCLNQFSRLSDIVLRDWLENVTIVTPFGQNDSRSIPCQPC